MKISKTFIYLIIIGILAFSARLFSAHYVDIGTDEMIYQIIPLNIISAERLSTIEQAPVYFYLVDLGYMLSGGQSLIAGRWPSIVFGAWAIFLVFLLSRELFEDTKSALLSSFLFALSGYAIRFNQEMDMAAFFLSLLSIFFFIRFLKGKAHNLYLSSLFLALAVLIKPIVLVFVPALALIWIIYGFRQQSGMVYWREKRIRVNTKALRTVFLAFFIAVIIIMPIIAYNYLLYTDKGITDYYFSVLAGVGDSQLFQGQEAEPWSISRLVAITKILFTNFFIYDALIMLLGIAGILFSWKKQKYYCSLFILSIAFLLLYLAGKMGSFTHYLWIPLVLSIFAGYGGVGIAERLQPRLQFRYIIMVMLLLALLNGIFVLKNITELRETSIAITLRDYARENIPHDAMVVLDPRIYRGIFAWSFNDRHYLEGTYFPQLVDSLNSFPGEKKEILLYYIECGPGTFCGWKPEDFQRIYDFGEQLSSAFRRQTQKIGEIKAVDTFIIYQGSIAAPPSIYETIDRTHSFWYTPVGWKYTENAIDNYGTDTFFEKALNKFSFFILWIDLGIALLSLGLVFFLLGRRSD